MAEARPYSIGIDLSSEMGTMALFKGADLQLVEERVVSTGRDHSERFLDELSTLLKSHSLQISDIGTWLSPIGPGSFTGLRIGFAALKAFAMVTQSAVEVADGEELKQLSGKTPLRASALSLLPKANSRKRFQTFEELVALSPTYSASKFD